MKNLQKINTLTRLEAYQNNKIPELKTNKCSEKKKKLILSIFNINLVCQFYFSLL